MGLFGEPDIDKMRARQDVKGLVRALHYRKGSFKYDHTVVRGRAVRALAELQAVEPLILALDSVSERIAAAAALGQIGDARAVNPLIELLTCSYDNKVPGAAAMALAQIGDTRAIEPIFDAVRHKCLIACDAVEALCAFDVADLAPLMAKKSDSAQVQCLASVLDKKKWTPGKDEFGARYWAAKRQFNECVSIGSRAVSTLVTILRDSSLKDEEVKVRVAAARALGEIGDTLAIGPLVKTLKEDPGWVKITEQYYAGRYVDPRGGAKRRKDNTDQLREAAARALGCIGTREASGPLCDAIHDEMTDVSIAAAEALGKIGGTMAVQTLCTAVSSARSAMDRGVVVDKRAYIEALGQIGDPQAIPCLTAALGSSYESVCEDAARALDRIRKANPPAAAG